MEPLSPQSPTSPVKATVDKFYGGKNGAALGANPSKKTFTFNPKSFYSGSVDNLLPSSVTDLSPTKIRANRDSAVSHFRNARHANARYAAFQKKEEEKKASMRSKSESALATKRMQEATKKIMALKALTGGGSFLERVAAEKLMKEAKGEKVETKMRVTEASSASLVVGRR